MPKIWLLQILDFLMAQIICQTFRNPNYLELKWLFNIPKHNKKSKFQLTFKIGTIIKLKCLYLKLHVTCMTEFETTLKI